MFRYLPEQASEHAHKVDWVHNLITDLSVFFTVLIVGAMLYFAIRYRKRDGVDHATPDIRGSHFLEAIWTIVPTIVCAFLAYYGVTVYREMRTVPADAYTINVKGRQWVWDFEYANGKTTTNELTIPVDRSVKLVMQSSDVLHSLFIPSMRVKADLMKGHYTYVTFKPIKTGQYDVFCTEYCGKDHSAMLAKLNVVSEAEFERWLNDRSVEEVKKRMTPDKLGQVLYVQKGCNACHSLDGTPKIGPSWQKIVGRTSKMSDGTQVVADENYIRDSILNPNKQIVSGFQPNQMPAFKDQLNDDEINALIAFMRTLDGSQPLPTLAPVVQVAAVSAEELAKLSPEERGKRLYEAPEKMCKTCHSLDGSKVVGPSFKGLYGRQEKMADGVSLVVDDAYLVESIKSPAAKIVEGFPPAMPQLPISDAEIKDLIAYIKTLK